MGKKSHEKKGRDANQVVLQQFEVTLAGKVHVVAEKSIKETTEFRRKVGEILADFADPFLADMEEGKADGTVTTGQLIKRMLPTILADGVDGIIVLLWIYAPDLTEFEANATDDEILDAALVVLEVALPLVVKVGKSLIKILKRAGVTLT